MPGNLVLTPPTQVMPYGLMLAFSQQIERPALLDVNYANGESTRQPLTIGSRSLFKVQRALTEALLTELDLFYKTTADGRPFWFYNLRETVPVGTYDITGANPVGRYTVVWDGTYVTAVSNGVRTVQAEYTLREVVG